MINELKEDLLSFLADKYFDENWVEKEGKNNFNAAISQNLCINNFSLGNFRKLEKNYLLVQVKSIKGDRNSKQFGSLGTINFNSSISLDILIEKNVTPTTAVITADAYINHLYDLLQVYVYNYRSLITPVNPNIVIQKFYSYTNETLNLNNIESVIINAILSFEYKANNLTLEHIAKVEK